MYLIENIWALTHFLCRDFGAQVDGSEGLSRDIDGQSVVGCKESMGASIEDAVVLLLQVVKTRHLKVLGKERPQPKKSAALGRVR